MKHNTQSAAERLAALIEESIVTSPIEASGSLWCGMCHRDRAEAIGVSEKTVRRIIGKPPGNTPFVSTTRLVNGIRTTLVRLGEPSPEDRYREVALVLRTIWRKHLAIVLPDIKAELKAEIASLSKAAQKASADKKDEAKAALKGARKRLSRLRGERETVHEFGCLTGLAKDWPEGLQAELFKMVLNDFPAFMSGVKTAMSLHPPTTVKTYPKELETVFLRYPHIATIRRFSKVAVGMLETKYQALGKSPPPALMAMNPQLWSHLKA